MTIQRTHVFIGGGAAGFFGAINSAEKNPTVKHIILEATHRPMTKIKISGGGRCNVTHHCFEVQELIKNYPRGSKELLGSFSRFQPKDTIAWFFQRGVELKVEKDGRMFPTTDNSETVIDCFYKEIDRLRIELRKGSKVNTMEKNGDKFLISLQGGEKIIADKVLLATGSIPLGYELAASLGHKITDICPSLFTFNCSHPLLEGMMGTAFKNVALHLEVHLDHKKVRFQQMGPMLITHWGLSGPAVLKLSAFAAKELYASQYQAKLFINWLGQVKQEEVEEAFMHFKKMNPKKSLKDFDGFDLTKRFFQQILTVSLTDKMHKAISDMTKKDLLQLSKTIVSSELQVDGKGVFKEEFVSCGGIDLKGIDFKSMESKVCSGLFFAGEILNIDGITGGFNFQNAWTTSWIAAQNM